MKPLNATFSKIDLLGRWIFGRNMPLNHAYFPTKKYGRAAQNLYAQAKPSVPFITKKNNMPLPVLSKAKSLISRGAKILATSQFTQKKKQVTMQIRFITSALVAVLAMGLWAPSTAAVAETSAKDLKVAARAVAFMNGAPTGAATAAVVYDPANAASKAEADAIHAVLSKGLKAGKAKLTSQLVSVADFSGLAGSKIAFLTGGLTPAQQADFVSNASAGTLSISTDISCVDAGNCIVGVATKPKVAIYVGKSAAAAAGVSFKSAFLMMVKER